MAPYGGCAAPGWNSTGEHSAWCSSNSRTYAIRSGAEEWEPWDAYSWSLGDLAAGKVESRPAICGVLVRSPKGARPESRPTVVAATNPILIGARPGEVAVCIPRCDVRAGLCVGFPWFEPIWAIPADPVHCDKRTMRVLLIGQPQPAGGSNGERTRIVGRAPRQRASARRSDAWCTAILTATSKGLRTEPSKSEISELWKSYKRYAKELRRGRR